MFLYKMSLLDLDAYLFNQITNKLTSASLFNLYRTCKRIQPLLISSVTNVDITSIVIAPRFVKKFKLTTLTTSLSSSEKKCLTVGELKEIPRTVTDLTIRSNISFRSISWIPPNLKCLSLPRCEKFSPNHFKGLPETLTKLSLQSEDHFADLSLLTKKTNIKHLDLRNNTKVTDKEVLHLPSGLTYLNLASASKLTGVGIQNLPRDLQHLILTYNTKLNDDAVSYLPRNLLTLDITFCKQITDLGISRLPKSLLCLSAADNNITDAAFFDLPPNLIHLSLYHVYNNASNITKQVLFSLPLCLRHLRIGFDKPTTLDDFAHLTNLSYLCVNSYVEDIEGGLKLSNLRHLHLLRNPPCRHNFHNFPRSLETLELDNFIGTGEIHLTEGDIPPNLTKLSVTCGKLSNSSITYLPKSLTYLDIGSHNYDSYSKANHSVAVDVKSLPRGLKHLSMDLKYITECDQLPENLVYLDLQGFDGLSDKHVRHLPRSITYLKAENADKLTDKCVGHFPPNLTHLDLSHNGTISSSSITKLPKTLSCLIINRKAYLGHSLDEIMKKMKI